MTILTITSNIFDSITNKISELHELPFDFTLTGSRLHELSNGKVNTYTDYNFFVKDTNKLDLTEYGFTELKVNYQLSDFSVIKVFKWRPKGPHNGIKILVIEPTHYKRKLEVNEFIFKTGLFNTDLPGVCDQSTRKHIWHQLMQSNIKLA